MNPFMKFIAGIVKVLKTPLKLWTQAQKLTAVVTGLSVILAGLTVTTVVLHASAPDAPETTAPSTTETAPLATTTEPTTAPTTEATTVPPTEPAPVITDKVLELRELFKENPHTFGWVQIPDSRIDEIVMFSPDKPDFYLYKKFNGYFSAGGTAYIDEVCEVDPESQVLQVYAHNMLSGKHFADLIKYQKESYWEEHPYIYFTTLSGARMYEIFAVVEDQDLPETAEGIKYYEFVDPGTLELFNSYIDYFNEKSLYDTGVTVEFDDRFLMLVTCAYHVENGRMVVLAKEVPYVEPPVTE